MLLTSLESSPDSLAETLFGTEAFVFATLK